MKTTPLGETRPETEEDILEIFDENGHDMTTAEAEISHEDWDPSAVGQTGVNMTGWTAEFRDEDGETITTTNGFENRDDLVQILDSLGVSYREA